MSTKINFLILLVSFLLTINLSAQDPTLAWVKQMGGTGLDRSYSIAIDASGNVYSTGFFRETVDFDPGLGVTTLTANSSFDDIYIQKLDANGNFLWVKQVGGQNADRTESIAVDESGNVYVTGTLSGDIYIEKLDTDGNSLWAKQFGGNYFDYGHSITTDATGNVYVTGRFSETVDFDPGGGIMYFTSNGDSDIYILKLDTDGNFIWANQMGGIWNDIGLSITTDINGDVYTTGVFKNTIDFDSGAGVVNLTSNGFDDIYIQKLDSDGNFLWVKQIGAVAYERPNSITTDLSGNVYTTGYFPTTADFDPGAGITNLSSNGDDDIFIQKLNSEGDFLWVKQIGGIAQDRGASIITDSNEDVYITGSFQNTADFDPGPETMELTSISSQDIYIEKLDANGNLIWVVQMGGQNPDIGSSVTVDALGSIYTTGYFRATTDFDPGAGTTDLVSNGNYDIYVQKLRQCQVGFTTDVQIACDSFTWIDGNTYTENNTSASFNIIGGASNGCDSIVSLNLTINNVSDLSTTVNGSTITASNTNATAYQWLDCDNGMSIISGETNSSFSPSANGNYAVQITENACDDISACVAITNVGIIENSFTGNIQIYPNPTKGDLAIEFEKTQDVLSIRLLSISGQLIKTSTFKNTNLVQIKLNQPVGVYLVEILNDEGGKAVIRLVIY